ncbi:MAG TPA: prepilin-type N-terminal cleavage/methylation domain-containing protein [Smithellaceae bacterium]|nr:prepilin-type N-terminal cleavage/methylation domain-containing protein [Smithellaceae bacterium]
MRKEIALLKEFNLSQKGFAFWEIVLALIILGILAAVAASRINNFDAEVVTGADTLKVHLRYAQTMAMNSNPDAGDETVWGISCSGGSYWLFRGTDPDADIIRLPDDEKYLNADDSTINLNKKRITVSDFTVFFDERGISYADYPATPWPGTIIEVKPSNGNGFTVNIEVTPFTGYVP